MIANAGHDEHGKLHGGAAGDQTGGEYRVMSWYNRPWSHVIRPKSATVGNMIAEISKNAANNNKVGYDQYQRLTYHNECKKVSWHPEKIKTACETDCTASTAVAVIAAGYRLGISALKNLSPSVYSGNIRKALVATGQFIVLTDSKYLKSDQYLLPGDILLYENHHAAVNLTKGSKVSSGSTSSKKRYAGTFPTIVVSRKYYMLGDGYKTNVTKAVDTQIRRLQEFLKWAVVSGLSVDGDYGPNTRDAVIAFQKKVFTAKSDIDGKFGKKSLAKAKAFTK